MGGSLSQMTGQMSPLMTFLFWHSSFWCQCDEPDTMHLVHHRCDLDETVPVVSCWEGGWTANLLREAIDFGCGRRPRQPILAGIDPHPSRGSRQPAGGPRPAGEGCSTQSSRRCGIPKVSPHSTNYAWAMRMASPGEGQVPVVMMTTADDGASNS